MNSFVELVNDLIKLLSGQFGPEAINIILHPVIPLKPLCALGSLNSQIAILLDLYSIPLLVSGKLDQL
jgi:hypothetical protein